MASNSERWSRVAISAHGMGAVHHREHGVLGRLEGDDPARLAPAEVGPRSRDAGLEEAHLVDAADAVHEQRLGVHGQRRARTVGDVLVHELEGAVAREEDGVEDGGDLLVEALPQVVGGEHARVHQRPAHGLAALRGLGHLRLAGEPEPDGDLTEPLRRHAGRGAAHLAVLEADGALGAPAAHGQHAREARLVHEGHEVGDGEAVQVAGQDAAGLRRGAARGGRPAGDQQVGRGRQQEEAPGPVRQRAADLVGLRDHAAVRIDVEEQRHPGC